MKFRFGIIPRGMNIWDAESLERRGLKNHGTTCYLNSLLQCLFYIGSFREAIYRITQQEDSLFLPELRIQAVDSLDTFEAHTLETEKNVSDPIPGDDSDESFGFKASDTLDEASVAEAYNSKGLPDRYELSGGALVDLSDSSRTSRALQKVFLGLDSKVDLTGDQYLSDSAVSCKDLIHSFNWDLQDQFTQHDAQELNRLLCDKLEIEMKNTPTDGLIKSLFGGESEMYIECIHVRHIRKSH